MVYRGKSYKAHRLAWLYMHGELPDKSIDHINGLKTDNRIANLRLATNAQQKQNRPRNLNNSSGYKGVARAETKWRARINANGRHYYLGRFDTPEDAHNAYVAAAHRLHGEFARTV